MAASSNSKRFKGVRMRSWGRWVSEIRIPRSRQKIWLGSYATPEQAARAFDAASLLLHRPSSSLNFPHSPPSIALVPDCFITSPRTIQATASTFANSSRLYSTNSSIATVPNSPPTIQTLRPQLPDSEWHPIDCILDITTPSTIANSSLPSSTDSPQFEPPEPPSIDPSSQHEEAHSLIPPALLAPLHLPPTNELAYFSSENISWIHDLISPLSSRQHNYSISDPSAFHNDEHLIDDFHPFDTSLASYGFTATSGAITISERFDIDSQPSIDSLLWNL